MAINPHFSRRYVVINPNRTRPFTGLPYGASVFPVHHPAAHFYNRDLSTKIQNFQNERDAVSWRLILSVPDLKLTSKTFLIRY